MLCVVASMSCMFSVALTSDMGAASQPTSTGPAPGEPVAELVVCWVAVGVVCWFGVDVGPLPPFALGLVHPARMRLRMAALATRTPVLLTGAEARRSINPVWPSRPDPQGGVPRRRNFNRVWKKALRDAGIPAGLELHL